MLDLSSCQGPRSSGTSSIRGIKQEERASLNLPDFNSEDDNDDEKTSENEVEIYLYLYIYIIYFFIIFILFF